MKNKKGFTLTELIAVLVIIGIILLVAIPVYKNNKEEETVRGHEIYFKTFISAINKYLEDHNGFYNDDKFITLDMDSTTDPKCYTDMIMSYKNKNYELAACSVKFSNFTKRNGPYGLLFSKIDDEKITDTIDFTNPNTKVYFGMNSEGVIYLKSIIITYKNNTLKINDKKCLRFYYNYKPLGKTYTLNGFYSGTSPSGLLKSFS